jgi:hypothetical protein
VVESRTGSVWGHLARAAGPQSTSLANEIQTQRSVQILGNFHSLLHSFTLPVRTAKAVVLAIPLKVRDLYQEAGMAELADAADSKSAEVHPSWGFNSPSRHQPKDRVGRGFRLCEAIPNRPAQITSENNAVTPL